MRIRLTLLIRRLTAALSSPSRSKPLLSYSSSLSSSSSSQCASLHFWYWKCCFPGRSWNRRTNVQGDPVEVSSIEWRSQLHPEARQRIVNKIKDILKRHLPINGAEDISELNNIAVRFEENIYTAATSQSDYLRKISMKMLTMEQKTQSGGTANPIASGSIMENQ